jgi:hypothetical protein
MPAGAKPGERRGGRPPGGKNKSTVDRERRFADAEAAAIAALTPDEIDNITPEQVMILAMRTAVRGGNLVLAHKLGVDVAPYLHSKKIASPTGSNEEEAAARRGYVVAPDQIESMEAWTEEAKQEFSKEAESGLPNPDLKPSC